MYSHIYSIFKNSDIAYKSHLEIHNLGELWNAHTIVPVLQLQIV